MVPDPGGDDGAETGSGGRGAGRAAAGVRQLRVRRPRALGAGHRPGLSQHGRLRRGQRQGPHSARPAHAAAARLCLRCEYSRQSLTINSETKQKCYSVDIP